MHSSHKSEQCSFTGEAIGMVSFEGTSKHFTSLKKLVSERDNVVHSREITRKSNTKNIRIEEGFSYQPKKKWVLEALEAITFSLPQLLIR